MRVNEDRSGENTSLREQIKTLRKQLHHQAVFIQVHQLEAAHPAAPTRSRYCHDIAVRPLHSRKHDLAALDCAAPKRW